ncbi:hypothetical protein SH528x_001222 [Novipirellula sp. SH528]|uniref:hypothetical protein n=1 Tax=Novipirellula sp. SH528 TaxID=3454466 RepID=UPI003F9F3A7F
MEAISVEHGGIVLIVRERTLDEAIKTLIEMAEQSRPGMIASTGEVLSTTVRLKDGQSRGTLVKLPAGYAGKIRCHGFAFRDVEIQGQASYGPDGQSPLPVAPKRRTARRK